MGRWRVPEIRLCTQEINKTAVLTLHQSRTWVPDVNMCHTCTHRCVPSFSIIHLAALLRFLSVQDASGSKLYKSRCEQLEEVFGKVKLVLKTFQVRWTGAKMRSWTHLYANWRVCRNYTDAAASVHLTDELIIFDLGPKLTFSTIRAW